MPPITATFWCESAWAIAGHRLMGCRRRAFAQRSKFAWTNLSCALIKFAIPSMGGPIEVEGVEGGSNQPIAMMDATKLRTGVSRLSE